MPKKSDNWPETSETLIQRVKDPRDAAAWRAFTEIYRPVVYRMARGRGLQDADAEDLVQQVMLSISNAIERWEPGLPPFRHWLRKLARNAIINAITRRKPDLGAGSTSVREMLDAVPESSPLTRELETQSREETMRWAAEQIRREYSDATWQMFWRTSIDGEPVAHVARDLSRSTGAVYMARYRVMQRLKEKVNEATDLWSER